MKDCKSGDIEERKKSSNQQNGDVSMFSKVKSDRAMNHDDADGGEMAKKYTEKYSKLSKSIRLQE